MSALSFGMQKYWTGTEARHSAMRLIYKELDRQIELKKSGKFTATCEDMAYLPYSALPVLIEEVGELARAMNEADEANFKEELVQVAAVAIAWLAGIEEKDLRSDRHQNCELSPSWLYAPSSGTINL